MDIHDKFYTRLIDAFFMGLAAPARSRQPLTGFRLGFPQASASFDLCSLGDSPPRPTGLDLASPAHRRTPSSVYGNVIPQTNKVRR